ncbi:putative glycolipid-binding domain-containing protein [Pedobacter sp. 22163]|uniref:putative glycolipid-binding domain-containing protein n=1 Tax=Pedobacter sp. 22163 TaxID=3453883 RepID=UPI003F82AC30
MERKIRWEGLEYKSLENCTLTETDNGVAITSIITGQVNNQAIKISYKILTDTLWATYFVEINVISGRNEKTLLLEKKGAYWLVNNTIDHRFDGCVDIDISLTPFTNTLPIRRLVFNGQLSNRIEVIYIDIIADMIIPVRQYYTKISDSVYLYEDEKSTFKAELKTDSYGLVIEYPKLFREK